MNQVKFVVIRTKQYRYGDFEIIREEVARYDTYEEAENYISQLPDDDSPTAFSVEKIWTNTEKRLQAPC